MKPVWRHRWEVTPAEARAIQNEARGRVVLQDDPAAPLLPARLLAADVGYAKVEFGVRASARSLTGVCFASLVAWDVAAGRELAHWTAAAPAVFPYVPGLLSFREIPALLPLFESLARRPGLVLCDGQGYAHPRRIGLASHLGVVLGCPTLGWAKSRLIGEYEEPPAAAGSATPLMDKGEQIGWVYRARDGVRPGFVSPGHLMSMARSLELARALSGRWRLCDPARRAHELTRLCLQEHRNG